jgi:hypothetical protein
VAEITRRSWITAVLVLVSCILFLWMFFVAATLEHTAELGRISARSGVDPHGTAFEFAARWRHGMAGNSPLYMPGFFAAAIAFWFWGAKKNLGRILVEGTLLIAVSAWCATILTTFGVPVIMTDFRAQGFIVSNPASSGTWVAFAQGVYSLITWSTLIIASRWAIKIRSPKPLLVPLVLNLILAVVRPWTVADFTSQWMREVLEGKPIAVVSLLLVPITAGFIAWIELRAPRKRWFEIITSR